MSLGSIEVSKNWNPNPKYNFLESFEGMENSFDSLRQFFDYKKRWINKEIEEEIRLAKKVMEMNLFHLEHNRLNDTVPQNKKKEMAEQINLLLEEIEIYLSQNYPAQKF